MANIKGKGGRSVRQRQLILILLLAVAVIAIAFLGGVLGTPSKPEPPTIAVEDTRKAFGARGENIDTADLWRTEEGARVTALEDRLSEMGQVIKWMKDERIRDKEKEAAAELEKQRQIEERQKEVARNPNQSKVPPARDMPPTPSGVPTGAPLPPPVPPVKGIMRIDMSDASGRGAGAASSPPSSGLARSSGGLSASSGGLAGPGSGAASTARTVETYLPAGTIMRGVLLAGLDAPTGGQSQSDAHPVLMEVVDMANLPNNFRADFKACRITGSGNGDLSSERARIRLDQMSCIRHDGGAVDVGIKGYVADSTGKAGIRGRLVSKQGQVLGKALLAGIASGMGEAFRRTTVTSSTTALGSVETVDEGKEYQAGIGTGVANALDRLSKYYIDLAEKLFPVIEVDAGQPVDIIIMQGVSLATK